MTQIEMILDKISAIESRLTELEKNPYDGHTSWIRKQWDQAHEAIMDNADKLFSDKSTDYINGIPQSKQGDGIVSEMQQYERVDHAKEMADKILDDVSGMDNRRLAIMQAEIHLSSVSTSEGIDFWTRVIKYLEK